MIAIRKPEPFTLLPLYLRHEPTTDPVALKYAPPAELPRKRDVVAYRDEAMTVPAGRWPWFYSDRPTRRRKTVTLNCYSWRPVWMPDL